MAQIDSWLVLLYWRLPFCAVAHTTASNDCVPFQPQWYMNHIFTETDCIRTVKYQIFIRTARVGGKIKSGKRYPKPNIPVCSHPWVQIGEGLHLSWGTCRSTNITKNPLFEGWVLEYGGPMGLLVQNSNITWPYSLPYSSGQSLSWNLGLVGPLLHVLKHSHWSLLKKKYIWHLAIVHRVRQGEYQRPKGGKSTWVANDTTE